MHDRYNDLNLSSPGFYESSGSRAYKKHRRFQSC